MRRPELGSPGLGLTVRMTIALVLNFLLLSALLAVIVWPLFDGEWEVTAFLALLLLGGAGVEQGRVSSRGRRGRAPQESDRARVGAILDRLCLAGGLTAPDVEIERVAAPLTWTTAVPWSPPTVHVSTEMLDRLDDARLEAALAHELGHIANRDAMLMTVIAWPPTSMWMLLREIVREAREWDFRAICALVLYAPFLLVIAVVFTLAGRIVARHRELAADRAAAVLTRSPARVSAALLAVAEGLAATPQRDLRAAAGRDPFHFVPVREARGIRRLWATHPPVEARLRQLAQLELTLQHG